MSDYIFTTEQVQKAFPDWKNFACLHMSISLNIAYRAGLILPREEKKSEALYASIGQKVESPGALEQVDLNSERTGKMSAKEEVFERDAVADYLDQLITETFNRETLLILGLGAYDDLKQKYDADGWPDAVAQEQEFLKILVQKIALALKV